MIEDLHLDDINCMIKEAIEIINNSNILIVVGLTLKEIFLLDQVRKSEDVTFVSDFETLEKGGRFKVEPQK